MRFPIIWIGFKSRKSKLSARDILLGDSLAFGMMNAHWFSSQAVDEAKLGPKAVLRNEIGGRIDKVTVEPIRYFPNEGPVAA